MFKNPTSYAKELIECLGDVSAAQTCVIIAARENKSVPAVYWRDVFLALVKLGRN